MYIAILSLFLYLYDELFPLLQYLALVAASAVWNSLPSGIHHSPSTRTFLRLLITHCFQPPPPSGSPNCLRFGHQLTLCTLNIHLVAYLLIVFTSSCNFVTKIHNKRIVVCSNLWAVHKSHQFSFPVKKQIDVFFRSQCLTLLLHFSLLPQQGDSAITSRLRSAALYTWPEHNVFSRPY